MERTSSCSSLCFSLSGLLFTTFSRVCQTHLEPCMVLTHFLRQNSVPKSQCSYIILKFLNLLSHFFIHFVFCFFSVHFCHSSIPQFLFSLICHHCHPSFSLSFPTPLSSLLSSTNVSNLPKSCTSLNLFITCYVYISL